MANYVKFRRGTPQAYANLAFNGGYNDDTLYFICEEDADDGVLYLGAKQISGGEISDFSIGDLEDIVVKEIGDKQILAYDNSIKAWVNVDYRSIIEEFVGTTSTSTGMSGLVPTVLEADKGKTNLFLRSDGAWAEISVGQVVDSNVFSVENTLKAKHIDLINEATEDIDNIKIGDIFIIKDCIFDNKYQHTSYIYSKHGWTAMDGNYNANNVYFDSDFIFTENIGTVEIPETGSIEIKAEGLNVKQFLNSLFAEEKNPETELPSATITLSPNISSYEVGSICYPKYKILFDEGSYTYGPLTEVKATYEVEDSNGIVKDDENGEFEAFTVSDETNYYITANITYTDGVIPVTNLGNKYEAGQIKSEALNAIQTVPITGYRKGFYGTLETKEELNSNIIRNLNKSTNGQVIEGSSFIINIPINAMRVVIAYPATLRDMISVLDKNDSNSNIVSGFGSPEIIQVKGANDFAAIDYKVYTLDFANPYNTTNIFTVTI